MTPRSHPLRHFVLGSVAAASAAMAACSDQPIAPRSPAATTTAASPERFDLASPAATLEWEASARELVRTHPTITPIVAGRMYALVGVGQYGAVVAADEGADAPDGGRALYEARRGAVAGASTAVLSFLFPDKAAALEAQLASDGEAGPGGTQPQFTRGVALGRAMGDRMIAWARADGFSRPWDGNPPADPLGGGWLGVTGVPAAGFQYPAMTPYYLTSPGQFRPDAPPARGTPEFAAQLQAVRDAMANRDADSVALANHWNLNVGTITALGYWDERAAEYVDAHHLDEREASHVFALVNSATMDATLACWDAKYHYMQIRPTRADPAITLVPGVPGFPYTLPNHPSYPSGHSCVSSAAARVIGEFFPEGTASLAAQVAAAGRSRVIGGLHYPIDISVGQALGRTVAEWAIAYDQQPGGLLRALDR